jgi:hypothetical protein
MSYARAVGQIIIDAPNADGWTDTESGDYLGIGRDWDAAEPRELGDWGNTPDLWGQYGWDYGGVAEYISTLQGIAPLGTFTAEDMALGSGAGQWTVENGLWRASSSAGTLRNTWLHAYDGRAGRIAADEEMRVISVDDMEPNLQLLMWRLPGAYNDTEPAWVALKLTNPDGSQQYGFVFPALSAAGGSWLDEGTPGNPWFTQPLFFGWPNNEPYPTIIDTMSAGSAPRLADIGRVPTLQAIRIEHIDGALIIRDGNESAPWVFAGDWRTVGGQTINRVEIGAGPVQIAVAGHTAVIACYELQYPAEVTVRPRKVFVTPSMYDSTAAYRILGATPGTTTIAASQETFGAGTRPAVTLNSASGQRPILYCVQEYREPTFSSGVSSPYYSQGADTFKVTALRGEVSEDWRGSTLVADIEAKPGETMPDVWPSAKLQGMVNVTDGAADSNYDLTDAITGTKYSLQFTGYVVPPEKARVGDRAVGKARATLHAADIIEARLRDNAVGPICSFEGNGTATGWDILSAFVYMLNCAGVPGSPTAGTTDGLISIDAAITAAAMGDGYYLPRGTARGSRKLDFRPDTDWVSAIDEVVGVCGMPTGLVDGDGIPNATLPGGLVKTRRGLQWGVGQDGIVFLRPAYEHTVGEYDFTVDDDTATVENMALEFRHSRSLRDFRNMLQVMVGEGIDAVTKIIADEASWSDSTSARFVGHVRRAFAGYPDGSDVDSIAQQLWDGMYNWSSTVALTMTDRPWIMPGWELRMQVSGVEVDTNSIYVVTSKSWASQENGRYVQTLQAVEVECGT